MGNLLWAIQKNERVWIVSPIESKTLQEFIDNIQDINGNLFHIENENFINHVSNNIFNIDFIYLLHPEEEFFKIISDLPTQTQHHILSHTKICNCLHNNCSYCQLCEKLSNEYGVYDYLEFCNNVY